MSNPTLEFKRVPVLFADGVPDRLGNSHPPESEILFPDVLPVTVGFVFADAASFVGEARLTREGGIIYADLRLLADRLPAGAKSYYPSIFGQMDAGKPEDGRIWECSIEGVVLHGEANVDSRIKRLGEASADVGDLWE